MLMDKRLLKLIYGIGSIILGIISFIFPVAIGDYFALIVGGFIILNAILLWVSMKNNEVQVNTNIPLIMIVVGAFIIIGWTFILQGVMIIIAFILFGLGIVKLKTISVYKDLNRKPTVPVVEGIMYLVLSIVLAVAAIQDKFDGLIGYIIGVILLILGIDQLLKFFNKKDFFTGKNDESGNKDLAWYNEKGKEFIDADWYDGNRKTVSCCAYYRNRFLYFILNSDSNDIKWKLPQLEYKDWNLLLDSSEKFTLPKTLKSGKEIKVPAWSILLFEVK